MPDYAIDRKARNVSDAHVLKAHTDGTMVIGKVGGTVNIYLSGPPDLWRSNYDEFGITRIKAISEKQDKEGRRLYEFQTEAGWNSTLKSPLGQYLAHLRPNV